MFPCGSRLVIIRQAVSACDEDGQGLEPAGLLDARPQFPDRAELGDGQELVLIGGEAEIDEAARLVERDAALLQCPQISDGGRKREGEFLRLGSACRVDHPAVRDSKGTGETLAREIGDKSGKDRRDVLPRQRALSVQGNAAERAEAEADGAILRAKPACLDESGEKTGRVLRLHAEIEIDGDAGIEIDIVERGADRRARRRKRVAVIADRALEHERLAACPIHQIVEDLRVSGFRVGEVDPLHDSPGQARGPALDAARVLRALVERLDADAVIGLGPEGGKRRAFQRLFDERLPRRLVGGREVTGEGEFHHSRQALSRLSPLLA